MKVFDKESGEDRYVNFDFEGLMEESQRLEGSGKYADALFHYEMAESMADKADFEKIGRLKFKMADVLQKQAADDSLNETREKRESYLDTAEKYLKESNELLAKAAFQTAETLHKQADDDSSTETDETKLAYLGKADEKLKKSDAFNVEAHLLDKSEKIATSKKRGFRLGVQAVMNTFKFAIGSTLNRHN